MGTTARDEPRKPLGYAPNVRERAQRFEEELATSPGEVVLRRMLAEMDLWFRKAVKVVARRGGLDPDDVYQEAALRLHTSRKIDPENEKLLAYVRKCIETAAWDLAARRNRSPQPGRDEDVGIALWTGMGLYRSTYQDEIDDAPFVDDEWLQDLLTRAGLPMHHRGVLLRLLRDGDMPLAELATMLRRSYAATRQDKRRALAGLRAALGLTTEEFTVYSGWHQGLSTTQIGNDVGLTAAAVDDVLAAAQHKIMQFFYPEPGFNPR